MKHLKKFCGGFVLVLALSIPVFAGDMSGPGVGDGPMDTPNAAGEMSTPGVAGDTQFPGITGDISTPGFMGDMGFPGLSIILALLF